MPRTKLIVFRERSGEIPLTRWLDSLPRKARAKCIAALRRLEMLGRELRRPEADYLRDGLHELRVRLQSINYRMLYFFYGRTAVVISHGLVKVRVVPPREIDRAIARSVEYEAAPRVHGSAFREFDHGKRQDS